MWDNAFYICNKLLNDYEFEYAKIFRWKNRKKKHNKHEFNDLFFEGHNYNTWFDFQDDKESDDEESANTTQEDVILSIQLLIDDEEEIGGITIMSLPEGHEEEIKEGKEIKILTSNKLLTKFLIVLPQTKAGNNSYKLKNKIRQTIIAQI